jgi:streptomycin 6-kinase
MTSSRPPEGDSPGDGPDTDADFVDSGVAARWIAVHQNEARQWLANVPTLIAELEESWKVSRTERLDGGSVSVVLGVDSRRGPAVLKLAPPWSETAAGECRALAAWRGRGAPELLDSTEDGQAILMERVSPGTAARGLQPSEVAPLVHQLQAARPPEGLPDARDAVEIRFARARENRHSLLEDSQLDAALEHALALARAPATRRGIVHGDLLGKNILRSDRVGLLAIDPNPFVGDPAYDLALWAMTERPIDQTLVRVEGLTSTLDIPSPDILAWIKVLVAGEICLAPLERARASLELARSLRAEWLG